MSIANRLLPLALLLPVLSGCGPEKNVFAPACPTPALVRELADLARYRPGATGRDLTDLVVQARIAGIAGSCEDGDRKGTVSARVTVSLEAVRGPALTGKTVQLPLFVAVTEGDSVLDKNLYSAVVEFTGNIDRVGVTSQAINFVLPVTATKSAAAYSIVAGFQIAPEEAAANRLQGKR